MSALRAPAVHIENPESPALPQHYRRRGGLRLVHPYHFDFVCNVKLRWHGMSIVDIFSREFPARPRGYYEEALRDGRLRVEGEQGLTAATPLHQGRTMRHLIHRHEPPVLDLPIPVLGETTDVVAVGKPPTLPVHVSGQYRKNTVLAVLQAERPDLGTLLPVHRLDKAVSGVLLFARSPQAADDLRRRIEGRSMEKVYVARVLGEFPSQPVHANVALSWDPVSNHVMPALDGPRLAPADGAAGDDSSGSVQRGEAAAAVAVAAAEASRNAGAGAAARQLPGSSQTGQEGQLWQQPKGAKAALTRFRRLAVTSDRRTSLVECRPVTGRTHQIRVHLQYLGHPIANDAQYGGIYEGPDRPSAFAIEDRQGGDSHQPAAQPSLKGVQPEGSSAAPEEVQIRGAEAGAATERLYLGWDESRWVGDAESSAAEQPLSRQDLLVEPEVVDPLCPHCPSLPPLGYSLNLRPLWLHACRYSCEEWSYECPPPLWAQESWEPPLSLLQSLHLEDQIPKAL